MLTQSTLSCCPRVGSDPRTGGGLGPFPPPTLTYLPLAPTLCTQQIHLRHAAAFLKLPNHAKYFLLSMKVVLLVSTSDIPFSKFLFSMRNCFEHDGKSPQRKGRKKNRDSSHLLLWLSLCKLETGKAFFLFFKDLFNLEII